MTPEEIIRERREMAVARELLKAEFDGHVSFETIRQRYGEDEAATAIARYRKEARKVIAARDTLAALEKEMDRERARWGRVLSDEEAQEVK